MEKKIIITGHTNGIGKSIYNTFKEGSCREILGMSRSNGYDIDKDFDKIVEEATGAEIFINNALMKDPKTGYKTNLPYNRDRIRAKVLIVNNEKITKRIMVN